MRTIAAGAAPLYSEWTRRIAVGAAPSSDAGEGSCEREASRSVVSVSPMDPDPADPS